MKINVLDHGYVEFIEAWGTGKDGKIDATMLLDQGVVPADPEVGIIEAARQSTQGGFRGWNVADRKLLKFLYEHKHFTPFEFAGMVVEVQAPIFVFREWHRHRTQSYNEMSARYAPLPDLYYEPDSEAVVQRSLAAREERNRQAASMTPEPFDADRIRRWCKEDERLSQVLEAHYKEGLAAGVPKELARKKMPVDHYSRMRAAGNLRNWLAFLTLRMDPAAQFEIRAYAGAVAQVVQGSFPNTWHLFCEGKKP